MSNTPDPSKPMSNVAAAVKRGQIVVDLLGGTPAMSESGERYIRKRPLEPSGKWDARVKRAVLRNDYRRTRNYLVGQVFAREPVLKVDDLDSLPDLFEAMKNDIDLQGNSLGVFAARFFAMALDSGAALILVEFPRIETRRGEGGMEYRAPDGLWKPKTAQADAENGWRPYFVPIPLQNLLGYRFETVNGKRVLAQLRFKEFVQAPGDRQFDEGATVEQVRILTPGRFEVWRQSGTGKSGQGEKVWSKFDEGETSLQVIPVAAFVVGEDEDNTGIIANPALEDLAHLNRSHWQGSADHTELMEWVRSPGMYIAGYNDDEHDLPWGPGILAKFSDPQVRMFSVGVDPASVAASASDLKAIEDTMALYGMQLLMPQAGNATATASALGAAESDSTLKRWAGGCEDCLDQAFVLAAMWVGADPKQAPSVSVNTEFHPLAGLDPATIILAAEKGIISKRMAFAEIQRRGGFDSGQDWKDIEAELNQEASGGEGPSLTADAAARLLAGRDSPGTSA